MQKEEKLAIHLDWGAGRGAAGPCWRWGWGSGKKRRKKKKRRKEGLGHGKSSSDEDLGSEWGPTAVGKVYGRGAVSGSLPTPRASFKALSRHLPTDEPA